MERHEIPNVSSRLLAELRPHVAGELRDDLDSRTLYSTDASLYQVMPYGVFIPRHADDMQAAVELAAKHHVPLLPRWRGSSLAGQSVNQALVMDTSRYLDQVLEINAEERWVRVQPGVVLDKLNGDLRPYGLQFGPDPRPANRGCLGGIVSNNATGSHSILYGMTADHVQEMQVILADGTYARLQPLEPAQVAWQAQQANRVGRSTGSCRRVSRQRTQPSRYPCRHAAPLAALRRLQPGALCPRRQHRPLHPAGPALQPGTAGLRGRGYAGRHH